MHLAFIKYNVDSSEQIVCTCIIIVTALQAQT